MAELSAPPSYDDVVSPQGGSVRPSAPPRTNIVTEGQPLVNYPEPTPSTASGQRRRATPASPRGQSAVLENCTCIERYITYSVTRHLRKYIEHKSDQQDPELDVEAQFGRSAVRSAQMAIAKRRRLQCISGWLWCIGVMLVLVYLALPTAMIIIGVVGINDCPFRRHTITAYLVGGGIVLAITVAMRTIPSVMTCVRNRNYCSTRTSNSCTGCICSMEILFYIALCVNIVVLILGTYTTFAEAKPPSCTGSAPAATDCCASFVFVSSAIFAVFQYVLYVVSIVFVCLVVCCIRSMDKEMGK